MYDLIIIGAGPAGSILACYRAVAGQKVALIEKKSFPRFKIGESLLPYSMEVFKEIGFFPKMQAGEYVEKFGALFVHGDNDEEAYFDFTDEGRSPQPKAFQVERAKFDDELLKHARSLGVDFFQEEVISWEESPDNIQIQTDKSSYKSHYAVDASGSLAKLSSCVGAKKTNPHYNNRVAVFGHFKNVSEKIYRRHGDIIIGVFPNGKWSWTIPLFGDIASIGVVLDPKASGRRPRADMIEEFIVQSFNENTKLGDAIQEAQLVGHNAVVGNFSYSMEEIVGKRWMAIGDAAHFLDPAFSTGVHIAATTAKMCHQGLLKVRSNADHLDSDEIGGHYKRELYKGIGRFHNLLQLFYGDNFIRKVSKVMSSPKTRSHMIAAVAGNMWDDDNLLFRMGLL